MRTPLAASLESRDGTTTKDAKVLNGIVEMVGEGDAAELWVRKRPGLIDIGLVKSGTAQALGYWNGQMAAVIADYLCLGMAAAATHVTTWNPSDKGTNITLSSGNLTATSNAGSCAVRSVDAVTAGTWYFETTVGLVGGFAGGEYIGLGNSSAGLNAANPGVDSNSIGYQHGGGIYKGNSLVSAVTALSNGDKVGVLYDADNRTIRFYRNNVLEYTATGSNVPSGNLYAMVGASGSGLNVTTNFGATSFTYDVPGTAQIALSPTVASQAFSMQDNGSNAPKSYLMVKNASQAWTYDGTSLAQITDPDYPGTYSVTLTSLTRSGTTATATVASDVNFQVGSTVTIAGATPSAYNGAKTVLSVTRSAEIEGSSVDVTITRSGTTATATTKTAPHGFKTGDTVTISGANESAYNGSFSVTWISATQFSFTVTVTTGGNSTTNYSLVSPATGTPNYYHYVNRQATASTSGGVVTVTSVAHGLSTGAVLNGGSVANQAIPYGKSVTVTGADTFTFTTSSTSIPDGMTAVAVYYSLAAQSVSSITGSGTTGTVTTGANHYLRTGDQVIIGGCDQPYYNSTSTYVVTITRTGATTFTYQLGAATSVADSPASPATGTVKATKGGTATGASFTFSVSGSPTSPATGTITATGGRDTVPGIGYLEGRFYVMDRFGVIYNCAEDDPSIWNALEFVTAQAETGAGKCLAKSLTFIAAFKEWSVEFFYHDKNALPPGSPLGSVDNRYLPIGCASGYSVAELDGNIFWISQAKKQSERSVYFASAGSMEVTKVSTPHIERILKRDDLATVHAYGLKLDGHRLYVLTLGTSDITIVYDMDSGTWTEWSALAAGSSKSVSSITRSGEIATVVTGTAHGLSDGDPVLMAGANQSDYNGIFQASYIDATSFSIRVENSPTTPATGTITATPYTETYWKYTKAANVGGDDMVLHESDGHLYQLDASTYQDDGLPINLFARVKRMDGGSKARKKCGRIAVVAEPVDDFAMLRFSDDDCATFIPYRRVDMSLEEPNIRRCGAFQSRTHEFRHIGNTAPRVKALEMEITQ